MPEKEENQQPAQRCGKTAAELLLRQLGDVVPAWQPETATLFTRLVVRESTLKNPGAPVPGGSPCSWKSKK